MSGGELKVSTLLIQVPCPLTRGPPQWMSVGSDGYVLLWGEPWTLLFNKQRGEI